MTTHSQKCPRIGANPEKLDSVNFRGPDWRKFSELCVLLFFLGKNYKMLPKTGFSKPSFGHPSGSTKSGPAPSQNSSDSQKCQASPHQPLTVMLWRSMPPCLVGVAARVYLQVEVCWFPWKDACQQQLWMELHIATRLSWDSLVWSPLRPSHLPHPFPL